MVTLLCLGSVLLVLSHLFENLIFFAPPSLFKLSSSALFGFTNPSLSFSQHGKSMDSSLFLKYSNHHTLGQSIKQNIFAVRDKPRLESLLKKDKIERTSSRAVMRGSIARGDSSKHFDRILFNYVLTSLLGKISEKRIPQTQNFRSSSDITK